MPRELSKCRNWEKERRNRLNECFKKLEVLLPCYEPSTNLSKPDILKKAAEYINELKGKVEKCLTSDPDKKPEHEEIKQLYASVKQLLNRNDQLGKLLKDAGISIPPASFNFRSTYPKMWSNVISPQKAAMLAKLEEQKENEPRKLVKRKCMPKKKVIVPKKQFVKPKIKKGRKKTNVTAVNSNLRQIVISGGNFNPVQNLMAVPNVQPCFFIANNISEASTKTNIINPPVSTVLSNSSMIATPILSSAANTPIVFSKPTTFPTGTIILTNNLPVIQPPTLIPPPIILNAPPANTVILVNKPKQANKLPEASPKLKTIVGSKPLQRICKKISNTTTTHVNKVPIPASRYASDYILVSKVQVAKTEIRRVKKVVRKVGVKRKNSGAVKSELIVKKSKLSEENEKDCDESKKVNNSDYSIDAICKDKPEEIAKEDNVEQEEKKAISEEKVEEVTEKPEKEPENVSSETLTHSELSNDIFASLQVPTGGQNPESTSPTAAFLNAFPLVSSFTGVKVAEVMEEETCDSQHGTPTLLQIGTMKPTHSIPDSLTPSLLNLDNFSFFSSKELYSAFDAVANEVTKVASKDINVISKTAKILYDTAVSETNYQMMPKLSAPECNHHTMPKAVASTLPEFTHQMLPNLSNNNQITPKTAATEAELPATSITNVPVTEKPKISTSVITTVSSSTSSSGVIVNNKVPVNIISDISLSMLVPEKAVPRTSSVTSNAMFLDKLITSEANFTSVAASKTTTTECNLTMLPQHSKTLETLKFTPITSVLPTPIVTTSSFNVLSTSNAVHSLPAVSSNVVTTASTITNTYISSHLRAHNIVTTTLSSQLKPTVSTVNASTTAVCVNANMLVEPMTTVMSNTTLSKVAVSQNAVKTQAEMLTTTTAAAFVNKTSFPLSAMAPQNVVSFSNNMSLPLTTQKLASTAPIFTNDIALPLSTQNLSVPMFTNNISLPLTTVEQQKLLSAAPIFTNMNLPLSSSSSSHSTVPSISHNIFSSTMLAQNSAVTVSHHSVTKASASMLKTMPSQHSIPMISNNFITTMASQNSVPMIPNNFLTTMASQNSIATVPPMSHNMITTMASHQPIASVHNMLTSQHTVTSVPTLGRNVLTTMVSHQPVTSVHTIGHNIVTTMASQHSVPTIAHNMLTSQQPITSVHNVLTTMASQNAIASVPPMTSQHPISTIHTIANNMLTTIASQHPVTSAPTIAHNMLAMSSQHSLASVPNMAHSIITTTACNSLATVPLMAHSMLTTMAAQHSIASAPDVVPKIAPQNVVTTTAPISSMTTAAPQKLATTVTTQTPTISYSINNSYAPFYNSNNSAQVFTTANYLEDKSKMEKNACGRYTSYNISEYNTFNPFTDLPKTSSVCNYTITKTYTQPTYTNNCNYNYQTDFNTNYPVKNMSKNSQYNMNYEIYDNANQYYYYNAQVNKNNVGKVNKGNETVPRPPVNWMTTPDLKNQSAATDFKHQSVNQPSTDFKHQSINQPSTDFKHQSANQPPTDYKNHSINQPATDFKNHSINQPAADFKNHSIQPTTDFKHQSVNQPATDFKNHSINQPPTDFKHQSVNQTAPHQAGADFKHQSSADFKRHSTADFKHQTATDFKHQANADFKHQSTADFKRQTDFKQQTVVDFKHQSAADFKHQTIAEFKQQSTADFKHQTVADFKHQSTAEFKQHSTSDFKHQSVSDFKQQSTAEFKQQSTSDFKHQSNADFKHQSTSDFKHQSNADFKHQSNADFKHQSSTSDFKHQTITDFKHQSSSTDFVVPSFVKETEFVGNIYAQNNFGSNPQTTYFNAAAPIYSTPEFQNNFDGKKLEMQFNNSFQRNDVEEHQFSWSPTKLPQLLDPAHSFVTTTLPTLVGDLALGNTQYSDKNKVKKDNRRAQNQQNYDPSTNSNFLSVSQLVDHNKSESTARITSRRNSGGRSKATTPKNTKNRNKNENKESLMNSTYKPVEKNVFNNTVQNNQAVGEWIGGEVKRVKQPPSSYSAEALIGQNQAKQRPQTQNYSKTLPVPTFFSENMLYFPPMDIQQDNNFVQQNQNYQNHGFPTTNAYSAPYLPSTNFIPEITDYNPVIPENIFSHANTPKIPETKQFNKPIEFNKAPNANKQPPANKAGAYHNTPHKKPKKKTPPEATTPGFVDFSFLSMPGAINSPILPDDFHAHSNFLPPPNPNQLYPCNKALYPKQAADLTGGLLPMPPVSRPNMQQAEVSPSINNTAGTSLTNFNLSTIFPEINKSTVPEMYLDPSKNKDYGLQRSYLPTSSQLPSFSKAPIYSTIKTQPFPNN